MSQLTGTAACANIRRPRSCGARAPGRAPGPGGAHRGKPPGGAPRGNAPGGVPKENPPGGSPRENPPGGFPKGNPPGGSPKGNPPGGSPRGNPPGGHWALFGPCALWAPGPGRAQQVNPPTPWGHQASGIPLFSLPLLFPPHVGSKLSFSSPRPLAHLQ